MHNLTTHHRICIRCFDSPYFFASFLLLLISVQCVKMQKLVLRVTLPRAPDEGEYKANALSLRLIEVWSFENADSD